MTYIVYKFTILTNGRYYVGQTSNYCEFNNYWGSGKIWNKCLLKLRKEYPTCWKKLIKREILYKGNCNQRTLDKLEEIYIRREKALYSENLGGCNILPGTANKFGSINPSQLKSCKEKQSNSLKKWWNEHPEERIKLSERRKGVKSSKETKEKISNSLRGMFSGEKNPLWGKKASEETRKKMSIAQSRRKHRKPHTEETKKKIAQSRRKYVGCNHPLYGSKFIWITNGVENKRFQGVDIPDGWRRGKIEKK